MNQLERCGEYVVEKGWLLDEESVSMDVCRTCATSYYILEFNHVVALTKKDKRPSDVSPYPTTRVTRTSEMCGRTAISGGLIKEGVK